MSKTAAIIPARWGSTRFPGKALHPIAGKPLVQHVWERTMGAAAIDSVIIATDDMRIADAAFAFGAEVSLTSPNHVSGTDRIAEVARKLPAAFTRIINVQGDEPVVDPALISRLAKTLAADPKIPMITAANPFAPGEDPANPNAVKVVLDRAGDALYFSRSPVPYPRDKGIVADSGKGTAATYYRHQGIYGYTRKFLLEFIRWKPGALEKTEQLEQLRALENGAKIRVLITKKASIGVDTPDDVRFAEASLKKL
ncbi:MAG TPA: 3-deoxy-manno-octulosonate cytidylyltransferase [Chthoniobacteraceae bacterium]|nr:3-deoxy-manno-octulosonate cytidylyltransferase [Chthoniobacteraceae bacterium]